MVSPRSEFREALQSNAGSFGVELTADHCDRLERYFILLWQWNDRLHLVGPCSPAEFAVRHVLESLLLLRHLPLTAAVVDVGSGGGLPTIPCLLMRPDLKVTLIESSQKKAVFLREALRLTNEASLARVISERFERLVPPAADFVISRALDRFDSVLPQLIAWAPAGVTFVLFVGPALRNQIQSLLPQILVEQIPQSRQRFLVIGRK